MTSYENEMSPGQAATKFNKNEQDKQALKRRQSKTEARYEPKVEITSKSETVILIYDLMNKGEANLVDADIEKLRMLTVATEKFEDEVLGLI